MQGWPEPYIHSVHTIILAGKSPITNYTVMYAVHIHGSGQAHVSTVYIQHVWQIFHDKHNAHSQLWLTLTPAHDKLQAWHSGACPNLPKNARTLTHTHTCTQTHTHTHTHTHTQTHKRTRTKEGSCFGSASTSLPGRMKWNLRLLTG